jgi:tight adherence protein C
MSAALFALGVFLAVTAIRRPGVPLEPFLATGMQPPPGGGRRVLRVPGGALAGAVAGALLAAAGPASPVVLVALGAAAGTVGHRAVESSRRQRRGRLLAQELPTVADTIALHIRAGESVSMALHRFVSSGRGVAADELRAALAAEDEGLAMALRNAASTSAHPEAARLYDLLGYAHRTGGRLADALGSLAAAYRSDLADAVTAEGARRSLAVYGPILALMVPVTLVFLMYPTLAGLRALAAP